MGIVVIGAIFVDVKGFPDKAYIPDGRNAGHIEYIHGGVSRNVAINLANIELNPTYISIVDDTAMGHDVLVRLQQSGVNTNYIQTIPHGMGTWLAVFDHNGDLTASISQRPNTAPLQDMLHDHGDEIFKDCDAIVIEFDLEREVVEEAIYYAKKYNKKIFAVIANMSIANKQRDMMKNFDCLVCNRQEAGLFFAEDFSCPIEELKEIIATKVKASGLAAMVVTSGTEGSVYATSDGASGHYPATLVRTKDTTGAGDAFFSGVVIGLTYGKTLAESVGIGTHLASAVVATSESSIPKFRPEELGLEL